MSTKKSPVLRPGAYVRSFTVKGEKRHLFILHGEMGTVGEVLDDTKFSNLPCQITRLQAKDAGPIEKKAIRCLTKDGTQRFRTTNTIASIKSGESRKKTREDIFKSLAELPTPKEVLAGEN